MTATNDPPTAVADSYAAPQGAELVVPAPGVLANDIDADGDRLSAVLVSGTSHGALSLAADGLFTYLPNS
ncbi:MAG: hypothetical protein GEV04_24820, partial [Actinophytocola sp.]|nr:hypothetical protein [Actinophytocola sp.]